MHAAWLLVVWICWCGLATPATGQGRTERHPELGLRFSRPAGFEAVPLPPEERQVVLRYRAPASQDQERSFRPACDFVLLAGGNSQAFLDQALQGWQTQPRRGRSQRWGYQTRALDVRLGDRVGYVHVWESAERSWVYVALCKEQDARTYLPLLTRWAERTRIEAPRRDDRKRAELERRYSGRRWADPEHRMAVQLSLVDGWKAHDTKHYIVVYHDLGEDQVREVMEHIEVLRTDLGRRFAAHLPSDVVSTVRLCRDREEYIAYGGPPQFAGHWNASAEELVLFDPGPEAPGELQRVLYHELFHQFIHHATGGVTPHPFFGEGWADYLGGAQLKGGRIDSIEAHPFRALQVQRLLRDGEIMDWRDFLELDPASFYDILTPAYAQAWSLVAFLESPSARRDYRFKGRLGRYFETLRSTFAQEQASFPGERWLPRESYDRARQAALQAFLDGLDWDHFEDGWGDFVEQLAR